MGLISEAEPEASSSSSLTSNGTNSNTNSPPSSSSSMSLNKLSSSLETLLIEPHREYCDADILIDTIKVGVHRCILAARSPFFHTLFNKKPKPKPNCVYSLDEVLPYGNVGYEAFMVFLGYVYTAKIKSFPIEVSSCVDDMCAHDSCRPAIDFAVQLIYASSIFQLPDLVSLFQRRLLNFVGKALVEDVIPILKAAFHCRLTHLFDQCIDRVARSDLQFISLEKELPHQVSQTIKSIRQKSQCDTESSVDPLREKRIRRIHKALDSDDVELVKLLLTESDTTLDDANALHYVAAYCDPKVVNEVLSMGLADVNLRNSRGYTVLHIAAMRKEPSIIVSLLTKGACASELTSDGQSAVSICRRSTRPKDYHAKVEQGQESNKDRLCIDVLEREMRRNPMASSSASVSSQTMADDMHMRLLHLENRVAFARLFFPSEAKLAMDIAHAETTLQASNGNFREVDLNETPTVQKKRLFSRMESLMRTVEMGRRYFPHCSEVLDKFVEDDLPEMLYLEKGTIEEQKIKRARFMELKDDVHKAFTKDKAEFERVGLSSASSSPKNGVKQRANK